MRPITRTLLAHFTGTLMALSIGVLSASGTAQPARPTSTQVHNPPAVLAAAQAIEPVPSPAHLIIPSIHVHTTIEHAGLAPDGSMEQPTSWDSVAWYKYGPRPGEDEGSSVVAGHLDSTTDTAVFWHIGKLRPGDDIVVIDDQGTEHMYRVTFSQLYTLDDVPMTEIFRTTGSPQLVLITCAGTWNGSSGYTSRLAVYAEPVTITWSGENTTLPQVQ